MGFLWVPIWIWSSAWQPFGLPELHYDYTVLLICWTLIIMTLPLNLSWNFSYEHNLTLFSWWCGWRGSLYVIRKSRISDYNMKAPVTYLCSNVKIARIARLLGPSRPEHKLQHMNWNIFETNQNFVTKSRLSHGCKLHDNHNMYQSLEFFIIYVYLSIFCSDCPLTTASKWFVFSLLFSIDNNIPEIGLY